MHKYEVMYFHNHIPIPIRQLEFAMELNQLKKLKPIKECDIIWLQYLIADLEKTDRRLNNER